jgi:hypothetical protein
MEANQLTPPGLLDTRRLASPKSAPESRRPRFEERSPAAPLAALLLIMRRARPSRPGLRRRARARREQRRAAPFRPPPLVPATPDTLPLTRSPPVPGPGAALAGDSARTRARPAPRAAGRWSGAGLSTALAAPGRWPPITVRTGTHSVGRIYQ